MMENKKAFVFSIPILLGLLVIAGVFYAYETGSLNLSVGALTGSGSYIERPIFKYVKCEAIGDLKYSTPLTIANAGQWLSKPSVSSSYNVKINTGKRSSLLYGDQPRIEYYICNSQSLVQSNCRVYSSKNIFQYNNVYSIDGIKNNEYVWVQYSEATLGVSWKGTAGATYQIGFVPYGLREYDVLSGSSNPINPNDCTDNRADQSSWTDRILGTNSAKVSATAPISKSVNQKTLQPEEVRWYVSGYVTSAAPSFMLTYQGQSAWCRTTGTSGEIYKINTITLGSGTYQIASPDYSDRLGTVTCCPKEVSGNKVCQSDFTWKDISGSECGSFKSCGSPNWVPYSSKELIMYSCVNGYCKSQTKSVGCANDADCADANKVCDLNSYTCVDANVNLKGQVIKTVADNSADCQKQGGVWTSSSTTTKEGILCIWGQGLCTDKVVVNDYCKYPSSWTTYLLYAIFLIIIALILIFGHPYFMPVLGFVKMYWWALVALLIIILLVGGYILG